MSGVLPLKTLGGLVKLISQTKNRLFHHDLPMSPQKFLPATNPAQSLFSSQLCNFLL